MAPSVVVGIGASAGGLEALTQFLRYLPNDTGLSFVVIQHLDPTHDSNLPELLSRLTGMPVLQVKNGMAVKRNHVYVVPPNFNMDIEGKALKLVSRRKTGGVHMPIDRFFRSLARNYGSKAVGIILSGTGSDGSLGLEEIKDSGGVTFAQDEKTAKFPGMPHSAIATGSVDFILSVEDIVRELVRIVHHPYISAPGGGKGELEPSTPAGQDNLSRILRLVRGAMNTDFTYYKNSTITRRIARRMALRKIDRADEYVQYLRENPAEVETLYHDLLIKVTGFFRDPETFEALKKSVIPAVLKNHPSGEPVRIWVPGCASGEEAYSIAICFLECLGDKATDGSLLIFATDVDEAALQKARAGVYIENISAAVSEERLRKFFTRAGQNYRINKSIRDMCTFARHDLSKDPPFSNLDLISCRNVLIYFEPLLQKRVLPIFHYALNPGGFLTLGASETIGSFPELFTVADRKHKIYARRPGKTPVAIRFAPLGVREKEVRKLLPGKPTAGQSWSEADVYREADRVLLNYVAPAGVLVNEQLEILQFRGRTDRYLMPAPGKASLNLLKMAREGLLAELKAAIDEAKKTGVPVDRKNIIRLRHNKKSPGVTLKVIPIKFPPSGSLHFLVLFEEPAPLFPAGKGRPSIVIGAHDAERQEIAALREDLEATKQHLQSIIESRETSNEELRTANEEVLSSNEELQSTIEELETAKEELQSTNEELTTANEEVQRRNAELDQANGDLNNLFGSANLPIIMLGKDLCIRRFTRVAAQTFNILPGDIGRPVGDLKLNIHIPDLESLVSSVISAAGMKEYELQDRQGRWYSLQIRPYKTVENRIDGAVLLFIDISSVKSVEKLTRSLEEARAARDFSEGIVQTVREPLLILSSELRVISANPAFYRFFRTSREETENQFIYKLAKGEWDIPELRVLLGDMLSRHSDIHDFKIERKFSDIGQRTMLLNGRRIVREGGGKETILLAIEDVTDRRRAEEALQMYSAQLGRERTVAYKELESFSYSVAHDLRTPVRSIVGFSQIVLKSAKGLDAEMRSYLERTVTAGKRMAKLIDDLLELSRLTRKEMKQDPVDLSAEARAIADELKKAQPERRAVFRIAKGLRAKGDPALVRVVLRNLLDNAWKFTGRTPRAVIEVGRVIKEGKNVFFVRDNGVGFDMAYVRKIFGAFQRLHDEREFPGTGIGLAIAHQIIQRHGGEIRAEAEAGRGAVFYFTFQKN